VVPGSTGTSKCQYGLIGQGYIYIKPKNIKNRVETVKEKFYPDGHMTLLKYVPWHTCIFALFF